MKLNRALIGFSSVAVLLTAAFATLRFVAIAKDAISGPAVRIDAKPVNRDPGSGNSYSAVVKKVAPSVVNIYSTRFIKQRYYRNPMMADPFFRQFFGDQLGDAREMTRRQNWLGSGVIVTPDGYVLTANHVVEGADEIKVAIATNKTEFAARIVGSDPLTDIAVLKIDAQNLPAVTLGDSSQLEVGDVVLAVGNPFGLGQTVTRGIVSALSRSLAMDGDEISSGPRRYQDFIQTDASINQGNSGGALVDAEGRLIGINDAIVSPSGASAGVGFAVPVNMARIVMEGFVNGGKVVRGYLGIDPQDLSAGLARSFGVPATGGVLVADVGPGTPAEKAGLKSGDVITDIDGRDISSAENLRSTVAQLRPGAKSEIKIIRDGVEKTFSFTVGELQLPTSNMNVPSRQKRQPTSPPRVDALNGVGVQDLDSNFRRQIGAPLVVVGAVVTDVDDGSNASVAGLRPGDVITEINHQPVSKGDDAVKLGHAARGDQILVKVWRRNGDAAGTRYLSVDNTRHTK
jgi:serine protease Do